MSRLLPTLVALSSFALLGAALPASRPRAGQVPVEPPPSVHALESARNPWDPRTMSVPLRSSPRRLSPVVRLAPGRVVYGYLPYWTEATATVRWELLSHLAYFDAPITASGTLSAIGRQRLESARFAALRDEAAARGVTFVITFTNFSRPDIGRLVGALRATTIATLVEAVRSSGAKGANVDFETVPAESRAAFVDFMAELTTRLHSEIPGSHVTSATPIIDWSNAYDVAGLLERSDGVMVMVYGCHYGGSSQSGPLTPLDRSTFWGRCSLADALDRYRPDGTQALQNKVIAGLPLYGYRWETSGEHPKSATVGAGRSQFWSACRGLYAGGERRWDSDSQTPWTTFLDAGKRTQVWCDDADSLQLKLELVRDRDVGGIGLWALGYEGEEGGDVWDRIAATFAAPENNAPTASLVGPGSVVVGRPVVLDATGSSDPDADPLTWRWTQTKGPGVLPDDPGAVVTFTPETPGLYAFELVVNDGIVDSLPAYAELVADPPAAPEADGGDDGGGGEVPRGCGCGLDAGPGLLGLVACAVRRRPRRGAGACLPRSSPLLALAVLAACAPAEQPAPKNEWRLVAPVDGTRFAPPATRTFEVLVEAADTACPGSEEVEVVAGSFALRTPLTGPVAVPFSAMIADLSAPDAEVEVALVTRLWCPGVAGPLATTTSSLTLREAVSATDVADAFGAGRARLQPDSRGFLFTRADGSAVGLLSPSWELLRSVTLADAGFTLAAPDRRLHVCGPFAADALPYCGVSSGGETVDQRETLFGSMGAASRNWVVSVNGTADTIAGLVSTSRDLAYAVTSNGRVRALTPTGGERWESSFSDTASGPGDVRLHLKAGGGLRALHRLDTGFVVRDFSAQGVAVLPGAYETGRRVLDFDFLGVLYAWVVDDRSVSLVNLEGEACTLELPAGETLTPFPDGRHAIAAGPAGGNRLAALVLTTTAGGELSEHLVSLDAQCTTTLLTRPAGTLEVRDRNPGLAVANDGTVFLFAGAMYAFTRDLKPIRETTPALQLGAPAVQCGTNVCALDAAGRMVALPVAP